MKPSQYERLIGKGDFSFGLVAQGDLAIGLLYAQGVFAFGMVAAGIQAIGYGTFGFTQTDIFALIEQQDFMQSLRVNDSMTVRK